MIPSRVLPLVDNTSYKTNFASQEPFENDVETMLIASICNWRERIIPNYQSYLSFPCPEVCTMDQISRQLFISANFNDSK